jgi:3-deoxy-D-manno-octulosonic-acid transferase
MTNIFGYSLYIISIKTYFLLIRIVSFVNQKAKLSIDGRKNIFEHIQQKLKTEQRKSYWFHCASLGEFEQARPIIEKLRVNQPEFAIIITFFSPSGYEIRKDYSGADYIFYLPFDSRSNAEKFIKIIKPEKAFFIKYEFWYHFLNTLQQLKVPTYLIAAHFTTNQLFFRWYGGFFRSILKMFTHIFTQFEDDIALLKSINIYDATFAGDPRFDRVYEHAKQPKELPLISIFCQNKKVIILGSSYHHEEEMMKSIMQGFSEDTVLIVAPHEVNNKRVTQIESTFSSEMCSRLSHYQPETKCNVLIIDNIGMLSNAYQYADVAFVGGGFGKKGLHNILEPLAMGCFVIAGPNNHDKFPEIKMAISSGVAAIASNKDELKYLLFQQSKQLFSIHRTIESHQFIKNNIGATKKILLLI